MSVKVKYNAKYEDVKMGAITGEAMNIADSLMAGKGIRENQITELGKKRLHNLVLKDPGEGSSSKLLAWEFLQFCFLDFIDCDTARTVLFRTRSRLQQRLSNFRQRSELCPHTGRFTNLWLSIETDRLETSLKSLNLICEEIDDELQLAKYSERSTV
mgnify:CR=1 FL=1